MIKITNVAEAADFIHTKVKSAKKRQAKDHACLGKTDLLSQVYVIRDGEPQVLMTTNDDAIKTGFSVAARVFNAEIAMVVLDGTAIEGERRHLLSIAVDRMGGLEFIQQFYDVDHRALELDKPITTGKPSFLKKFVKKDMHEVMAEPTMDIPGGMAVALSGFKTLDTSPVSIQAFIDLAAAASIEEHTEYSGIRQVALIAEPDSPRAVALRRPGLPIFK